MPGEIAKMMLSGLLDEETGELIDGDAPGYPRRMSEGPLGFDDYIEQARRATKKMKTPAQRARIQRKRQKRRERVKAARAASQ